jgi:hypothetical protein
MALPSIGGGRQFGDGNLNEVVLGTQAAPASLTSTATLTIAQLVTGIVLGNPGSSAATYTLPTVALTEALLVNAKVDSSFDFSVINVDGSGSGVITLAVGTGWTIVGLATVAATAGTTQRYRARKTGVGTWTLYTLA